MRHRPFTDGLEPVPCSERAEWYRELPINADGCPTNELAAQVLQTFFTSPHVRFGLTALAEELFLDPRQLLVMLRQLTVLNLIEEAPLNSLRFRLTAMPWNQTLFDRVSAKITAQSVDDSTARRELRYRHANPKRNEPNRS